MRNKLLFKSKKGKFISYVLRFAVAGGALYLAFRGEDLNRIVKFLLELSPVVILAAIVTWLASQLIFVSRWLLLLRVQSIGISFWAAFRLHLLGIFYNNCLPSAVGGDFLRAWYVTSHTERKLEAALSVFVDRLVGITAMIIMAVFCYWVIPVEGYQDGVDLSLRFDLGGKLADYWWVFAGVGGFIAAILAGFLVTSKGRVLLKKFFYFAWRKGLVLIKKARKAMLIYWGHKVAFLFAYLLSFACQGIFIIGMWLVGRDLGIDCPAKYYFVFFPVAWMVGAVPVSVGGLGIWEGVLILFFVSIGVEKEHIAALALFHRALWLFGSLPGVVIHLCGAHLPKDISIDYREIES